MAALPAISTEPLPLQVGADGVIRVGGTRVSLDVVVAAFDEGCTAEEIAQQYPTLVLADIYAVLGHVLRHRPEIDAYVQSRRAERESVRREAESRSEPAGIRARLMARRPTE